MAQPILYLMLGYPGSGKTTASKVISELTGAIHLWADHERLKMFPNPTHTYEESLKLYARLNKDAGRLLSEGKSVIFDTNFNFYKDRQRLRKVAAEHGAKAQLLWVRTPKEIAKARATGQKRFPYNDTMPPERFDRKARNLQKPRSDEEYIELDGTRVSEKYIKELLGIN